MNVPPLAATGLEVHINDPRWKEYLGSSKLPVKSFTPETICTAQQGTLQVYFVDLARLTDIQRGGLMVWVALTDRLWSEAETHGLPIPCKDCTPVQ